jgi:hypothetical protein
MTTVLNRLMFYALGTGLATSCLTLIGGIVWLVKPNTFIYIAISFIATKMHVNSLLITLNARYGIQQQLYDGPTAIAGFSGPSLPREGVQSTIREMDNADKDRLRFKTTSVPEYAKMSTTHEDIEMHKAVVYI